MQQNNKAGFTLIETIVVTSLFTLLSLVIGLSIVNLYQSNGYTIAQSYEVDNARRGLQTWLGDAREMIYADDGTFPIAVTEPHRLGFYSDIDKDFSTEYTLYQLATTTLYKYTYEATGTPPVYNLVTPSRVETLSEYVQNLIQATSTFKYFDTNGTQITASSSLLTDIRYVEMRMIVNIDPLRSPGEFLLQGGVAPRNLKDNL
jgi:prepilin-type N-terminal cleavage/methylation domain-containing protein